MNEYWLIVQEVKGKLSEGEVVNGGERGKKRGREGGVNGERGREGGDKGETRGREWVENGLREGR